MKKISEEIVYKAEMTGNELRILRFIMSIMGSQIRDGFVKLPYDITLVEFEQLLASVNLFQSK